MPKKIKKTLSTALFLSLIGNIPFSVSAADLVPFTGNVKPAIPSNYPSIVQNSSISIKSIESKISNVLNPDKKEGGNKVKRKVLATDKSGSCGDGVTYTFTASTGELKISGSGDMTSYPATSSVPWYSYRDSITSLIIGNGVTSIGLDAFGWCSKLTSVNIPNSVTSIGSDAFYGCSKLTSVTIPNSVTSIDDRAFSGCKGLTGSLTIPNSVTSIGSSAFYGCSGLTGSLTIPEGVTSIGEYAFYGCSGLTSVTIPESVTSIGYSAFRDCSGLTSVTIPSSVTSIGGSAFSGCYGLTSVTIPSSVTSIGSSAFDGCTGLTSVIYTGTSDPQHGNGVFNGCTELKVIKVPRKYKNNTFCGLPIIRIPATKNFKPYSFRNLFNKLIL